MLISLQKNIAFLAMTKTGSTTIEAELAPFCDIVFQGAPNVKHIQVRRFERFLRPYLETIGKPDIQTTCLFREPLDWLGSWYRYRRRAALDGKPNSTAHISFDDFVVEYMKDAPEPFAQVGRQSNFVARKNGEIGVDFLFRYEDFDLFADFISERFGERFDFGHLNASPKADLGLTAQNRQKVIQFMRDDYEIFEAIPR